MWDILYESLKFLRWESVFYVLSYTRACLFKRPIVYRCTCCRLKIDRDRGNREQAIQCRVKCNIRTYLYICFSESRQNIERIVCISVFYLTSSEYLSDQNIFSVRNNIKRYTWIIFYHERSLLRGALTQSVIEFEAFRRHGWYNSHQIKIILEQIYYTFMDVTYMNIIMFLDTILILYLII